MAEPFERQPFFGLHSQADGAEQLRTIRGTAPLFGALQRSELESCFIPSGRRNTEERHWTKHSFAELATKVSQRGGEKIMALALVGFTDTVDPAILQVGCNCGKQHQRNATWD